MKNKIKKFAVISNKENSENKVTEVLSEQKVNEEIHNVNVQSEVEKKDKNSSFSKQNDTFVLSNENLIIDEPNKNFNIQENEIDIGNKEENKAEEKNELTTYAEKIEQEDIAQLKIKKNNNKNVFKLISDDYYYNRTPATLEAVNLTKIFKKRVVLKNAHIIVKPKEIVALLGPNGAGKTTMFSIILGILNPTEGEVIFNNKVINELPIHLRARQGISYLPQSRSIFRGLTVEENIKAVAEVAIKDKDKADQLVEHLLNEFKITHLRSASALSLSGGEARRVEIARCLTTSPKILLLDEPFAALDPIAILELKNMLKGLTEKGISIFITDHNVKETLDIVDRAYIINNGEIIAEGTPKQIVENKTARQFYLGSNFRI